MTYRAKDCVVCGKRFVPECAASRCCDGAACMVERRKRASAAWEKAHRPWRNQYHRHRRKRLQADSHAGESFGGHQNNPTWAPRFDLRVYKRPYWARFRSP
jgi:hypothetical protein